MKKSRFFDSQSIAVLEQTQAGTPVQELCRTHGISSATFYKWRLKFGGMDASIMSRLKELDDEDRRLKKMYAEAQLSADVLKQAMVSSTGQCNSPYCCADLEGEFNGSSGT